MCAGRKNWSREPKPMTKDQRLHFGRALDDRGSLSHHSAMIRAPVCSLLAQDEILRQPCMRLFKKRRNDSLPAPGEFYLSQAIQASLDREAFYLSIRNWWPPRGIMLDLDRKVPLDDRLVDWWSEASSKSCSYRAAFCNSHWIDTSTAWHFGLRPSCTMLENCGLSSGICRNITILISTVWQREDE
jgi:hypothetical protein